MQSWSTSSSRWQPSFAALRCLLFLFVCCTITTPSCVVTASSFLSRDGVTAVPKSFDYFECGVTHKSGSSSSYFGAFGSRIFNYIIKFDVETMKFGENITMTAHGSHLENFHAALKAPSSSKYGYFLSNGRNANDYTSDLSKIDLDTFQFIESVALQNISNGRLLMYYEEDQGATLPKKEYIITASSSTQQKYSNIAKIPISSSSSSMSSFEIAPLAQGVILISAGVVVNGSIALIGGEEGMGSANVNFAKIDLKTLQTLGKGSQFFQMVYWAIYVEQTREVIFSGTNGYLYRLNTQTLQTEKTWVSSTCKNILNQGFYDARGNMSYWTCDKNDGSIVAFNAVERTYSAAVASAADQGRPKAIIGDASAGFVLVSSQYEPMTSEPSTVAKYTLPQQSTTTTISSTSATTTTAAAATTTTTTAAAGPPPAVSKITRTSSVAEVEPTYDYFSVGVVHNNFLALGSRGKDYISKFNMDQMKFETKLTMPDQWLKGFTGAAKVGPPSTTTTAIFLTTARKPGQKFLGMDLIKIDLESFTFVENVTLVSNDGVLLNHGSFVFSYAEQRYSAFLKIFITEYYAITASSSSGVHSHLVKAPVNNLKNFTTLISTPAHYLKCGVLATNSSNIAYFGGADGVGGATEDMAFMKADLSGSMKILTTWTQRKLQVYSVVFFAGDGGGLFFGTTKAQILKVNTETMKVEATITASAASTKTEMKNAMLLAHEKNIYFLVSGYGSGGGIETFSIPSNDFPADGHVAAQAKDGEYLLMLADEKQEYAYVSTHASDMMASDPSLIIRFQLPTPPTTTTTTTTSATTTTTTTSQGTTTTTTITPLPQQSMMTTTTSMSMMTSGSTSAGSQQQPQPPPPATSLITTVSTATSRADAATNTTTTTTGGTPPPPPPDENETMTTTTTTIISNNSTDEGSSMNNTMAPPPPPIEGSAPQSVVAASQAAANVVAGVASSVGAAPTAAMTAARVLSIPQVASCTGRNGDGVPWLEAPLTFPQTFFPPSVVIGPGRGGFVRAAIVSIFVIILAALVVALAVALVVYRVDFSGMAPILLARVFCVVLAQVLSPFAESSGVIAFGGAGVSDVALVVTPLFVLGALGVVGAYLIYSSTNSSSSSNKNRTTPSSNQLLYFLPSEVASTASPSSPSSVETTNEPARSSSPTPTSSFLTGKLGRFLLIGDSVWYNPGKRAVFALLHRYRGREHQQQNNSASTSSSLREKIRGAVCPYTFLIYALATVLVAVFTGIAKASPEQAQCKLMLNLIAVVNTLVFVYDLVFSPAIVPIRDWLNTFLDGASAVMSVLVAAKLGSEQASRENPGLVAFVSTGAIVVAIVAVVGLCLITGGGKLFLKCKKLEIVPAVKPSENENENENDGDGDSKFGGGVFSSLNEFEQELLAVDHHQHGHGAAASEKDKKKKTKNKEATEKAGHSDNLKKLQRHGVDSDGGDDDRNILLAKAQASRQPIHHHQHRDHHEQRLPATTASSRNRITTAPSAASPSKRDADGSARRRHSSVQQQKPSPSSSGREEEEGRRLRRDPSIGRSSHHERHHHDINVEKQRHQHRRQHDAVGDPLPTTEQQRKHHHHHQQQQKRPLTPIQASPPRMLFSPSSSSSFSPTTSRHHHHDDHNHHHHARADVSSPIRDDRRRGGGGGGGPTPTPPPLRQGSRSSRRRHDDDDTDRHHASPSPPPPPPLSSSVTPRNVRKMYSPASSSSSSCSPPSSRPPQHVREHGQQQQRHRHAPFKDGDYADHHRDSSAAHRQEQRPGDYRDQKSCVRRRDEELREDKERRRASSPPSRERHATTSTTRSTRAMSPPRSSVAVVGDDLPRQRLSSPRPPQRASSNTRLETPRRVPTPRRNHQGGGGFSSHSRDRHRL